MLLALCKWVQVEAWPENQHLCRMASRAPQQISCCNLLDSSTKMPHLLKFDWLSGAQSKLTVCLVLHITQMNQTLIRGRQYTFNLSAKRLSCSSNAWSGLDHYKGSRVIIYPDAIGSVILCHSTACWHQDHLQDRSGASAYHVYTA